eukprot:jgi/Psemu1/307020/fgenesh1_kg.298_\
MFGGSITTSQNRAAWASAIDSADPDSLVWESRQEFPGGGRHHPITFANATHGFVLSGSTLEQSYTSDFWVYEEATDSWTDLSGTDAAFPGGDRSFGYGVASTTDCGNAMAYLGFGVGADSQLVQDWWEFDMSTLAWRKLADFPGEGRRHPAMNFLEPVGQIHVGLGDGYYGNYNDYWSYDIATDTWQQLQNFPSSERHHPFYFAIDTDSYVGLGHSTGDDPWIERDWYRYDALSETWNQEADFASYALGRLDIGGSTSDILPVTTEARVAGTQFSVAGSCYSDQTLGFVLSGDGDNHDSMETGEFHVFDPAANDASFSIWHSLPPHPGFSRWAPGSFVLQGSNRAYLFGGYDRSKRMYFSDLWTIDLEPLFDDESILDNNAIDVTKEGLYFDSNTELGSDYADFSSSTMATGNIIWYWGLPLILAFS